MLQSVSFMQYYTDSDTGGHTDNKDAGLETRKFFLNCLCLLVGRLDSKRFKGTAVEYGMQISHFLLPQVVILKLMCNFMVHAYFPS